MSPEDVRADLGLQGGLGQEGAGGPQERTRGEMNRSLMDLELRKGALHTRRSLHTRGLEQGKRTLDSGLQLGHTGRGPTSAESTEK